MQQSLCTFMFLFGIIISKKVLCMEKWTIYDIFNKQESIVAGSTVKSSNFFYKFSLAVHTGEDIEQIKQNRAHFASFFPKDYGFVAFNQIHSSRVVDISEYDTFIGWPENSTQADGMVTTQKGVVLTTFGADCLTLLMYDKIAGVIGAAHSGWRGTAQNVAKALFEVMAKHGAKPERTLCAITPGIRQCCYEVGSEVIEHFLKYPSSFVKKSNGKYNFDNATVNYMQLLELGFLESNIELSPICTGCQSDRYFSYRKENGCSGRFVNFIAMKK